ncbi:ribosomal protection-like ABC-F family protein [Streptomyces liangshanensis]|uniref:ABC-F family ATP-binding cassette domain-containing protein n=1 Tax=Streptomyces liangshanensis TaxID=2717324 RepID=A0A6G9GXN8_9ACTN|nr:ABC-F family ATP-binding cassette domain-containing protein [Streptomyces liangshanensis]QIQ02984.1 ABC-F family ATP-binding cassette domain-containing protein [Streptomyces liangshanensis]
MRERAQLAMKHVSKTYGDRPVLDQVSLTVRPGEKAGIIGENGSGKSTLLRLLAGAERPDDGEITVRFPGGTGHLAQTLDLAPPSGAGHRDRIVRDTDLEADRARTVQDAVDAALADLRDLERRLRAAEAALGSAGPAELAAYGDLLTAYEERDGYRAETRVDTALHALGLAHLTRDRPLDSLSGGERSRLALACVLAPAPELLLLDEPTNHLDLRATTWLEDQLRTHRGTVLAVTHDRVFLERIATTILEVDRDTGAVTRYGDGWAGYRAAKAADRRRRAQDHAEWLAEVSRTEEQVAAAGQRLAVTGKDPGQGFGKHRRSHETKLSGQVRAARERLARLRREPVPAPPEPLRFTPGLRTDSAPGAAGTELLLSLEGVTVGDRLRVDALSVGTGARLLVTGPNGAGKTTLLRVLAGELRPDSGTVRGPDRIRRGAAGAGGVGYLPQELPAVASPLPLLAAFAAGRPGPPDEHADELLGLGLFREADLRVPVAALSIGQRRRLELARLVTRPADLLILDEPTNHLALGLVEELEAALVTYAGAVVVVSHDRRFRDGFAGRRLELRAGRVAEPAPAGRGAP